MRVLMMNPLEVKYYANCSDSTLYEFIGYRNELAMLNMTIALLQNRLLAIQKLSVDRTHLKPWQRFIFMYRDGIISSKLWQRIVDQPGFVHRSNRRTEICNILRGEEKAGHTTYNGKRCGSKGHCTRDTSAKCSQSRILQQ